MSVRVPIMFQPTLEQVRRTFRVISGFTLLGVGTIMLVTPGPGWVTIFFGLSLLAAEFVWARRLMNRIKREGGRIREAVLGVESKEEVGHAAQPQKDSKETS